MNKATKIILSIIGIGAIIIPAVLLVVFTGKTPKEPPIASGSRQLDTQNIKETVEKVPPKQPEFPSPVATASASPSSQVGPGIGAEGSPSAQ